MLIETIETQGVLPLEYMTSAVNERNIHIAAQFSLDAFAKESLSEGLGSYNILREISNAGDRSKGGWVVYSHSCDPVEEPAYRTSVLVNAFSISGIQEVTPVFLIEDEASGKFDCYFSGIEVEGLPQIPLHDKLLSVDEVENLVVKFDAVLRNACKGNVSLQKVFPMAFADLISFMSPLSQMEVL